jgi:hypothetical protein
LLIVLSSQCFEEPRPGLDQDPPLEVWRVQAERVVHVNDVRTAILLFDHNPIRGVGGKHPNERLNRHITTIILRWNETEPNDFMAIAIAKPPRELRLV